MIDAEHKKTHTISIESVINELEKSDEYKDRFQLCHTHFQQDKDRWNQRRKFEVTLATELNNGKGIKYFAYIKFYLDKDKKYALVAGKSGSRLVNVKSDVCFLSYPKKGLAKKWLYEHDKEWYVEEVLIVWALADDKKANEKEAFAIERDLIKLFGLYKS